MTAEPGYIGIASTVVAASAPIEPAWRGVLPVDPAAELIPPLCDEELCALADDIEVHGIREPIVLRRALDGTDSLLEGRSRLDAGTLADLPIVKDGKINLNLVPHRYVETDDPVGLVLSLNLFRRHLTTKQKRDLIAKLVKAQPEASNNAIAKQVKVDDKTVGKVREELERRSEIPNASTRIDSTGRRQAAHRRSKPNAAATEGAPAEQARAAAPTHAPADGLVASAERRKADHAAQELAERKVAGEPPPCEYANIIWCELLTAEHRETIERRILDAFFETATAAEIYARLPAAKHAEMLAAFSIETARAVFGERLRATEPEKDIPKANPRIDPNAVGLIEDGVTAEGQAPKSKTTPTAGAAQRLVEAKVSPKALLAGWRKLSADKLEARINEIRQVASNRRHPHHFKDQEWVAVDRMRERLQELRRSEKALADSQAA